VPATVRAQAMTLVPGVQFAKSEKSTRKRYSRPLVRQ